MDTDFSTTQQRYEQFMAQTPSDIAESIIAVTDVHKKTFHTAVAVAKRIIFTGTGSSLPAAQYGMHELLKKGLPATFMPLGSLLDIAPLEKDDLVVLCSQGMNRADAALAVQSVRDSGTPIVIFTANTDTDLTTGALLCCYFVPKVEKLFCRPDGVAANLAAMAAMINGNQKSEELVKAWQHGTEQPITLSKDTRYVTLGSGGLLPVNWNMALALREGCGVLAQNFDIETYAHGNYVGDLAHVPYEYIVLSMDTHTEADRSVRRFMPFIKNSGMRHTLIRAPYADAAHANMYILGVIAQSVYDLNQESAYNMNIPRGKEENRYYHELESYEL